MSRRRALGVVLVVLLACATALHGQDYYRGLAGLVNGPLLFTPDSTFDIGANGANRPASIWASNAISALQYQILGGSAGKYAWAGGNALLSGATPTIASGFGTTPGIAGTASVFRVTLGNPVAQAGVVNFNLAIAFGSAPIVNCRDETTQAANPPTYTVTTTQVTITFTAAVAADKVGCIVLGLP